MRTGAVQPMNEASNIPSYLLVETLDPSEMLGIITALEQKVSTQAAELQQTQQQLKQEINSKKQVEEALRQSQLELEQKVLSRTSELLITNKLLEQEIQVRQQAELKIHEQAKLLDVATDAILVRGLDSKILYWNKGAERLYGWQAEEVIGKNANEFLYPENSQQAKIALKKVMDTGSWQGELNKIRKDGKEVIVESHWTVVRDEKGNVKSILTVDTDITEKKQLQIQFFRAQRLESLGSLASGIAHDLNNILTPILAAAQILPLRVTNLDEQSQLLLQIVEENSKRGSDLVKQILSFARGVEGKRTVIQVRHILAQVVQVARETFPKSIQIFFNTATKDLWTVLADTTQLHQVLMNLAVNARDAMPDGGTLTFTADNIYIDESYVQMHLDAKVGHYIAITVCDTGCGIPEEITERIFEPFFTTKDVGKGTGLGLSTVLGIIKSHGGFVKVDSEVGQGTKFSVYLPASEEIAKPAIEDIEMLVGNGELILVADDEASIREIIKASLSAYNYQAITVNDGVEAISIFAKSKHDTSVVLLDLMMPSLDAPTTIRTLKQINPQIKIIAMSGLVSNKAIVNSTLTQIQAFLLKPFTVEELLRALHKVLTGS